MLDESKELEGFLAVLNQRVEYHQREAKRYEAVALSLLDVLTTPPTGPKLSTLNGAPTPRKRRQYRRLHGQWPKKILDVLEAENGPLTYKEIVKRTGCTNSSVSSALRNLKRRRNITQLLDRTYTLK